MTSDAEKLRLYEMLFNAATEGLIIVDRRGHITWTNPRSCEMFGYNAEELKQMNVDDLLPKHLKDKHVRHREGFMHAPHMRPMGQGIDLIAVRKDGSSFPIEISLNHFQGTDGELNIMALIMDVTKRKEQEAEIKLLNKHLEKRVNQRTKELKDSQLLYRMIARNFPDGTINVFDREFNYVFVEGAEMYKHGITSEKLVGKNYIERLPVELQEIMRGKLQEVFDGKSQKFEVSYQDQYYVVNTVGLLNDDGRIDRVLLVEQNITDRKLAEERVRESLDKERQLNELKSRFVSMASHEFRTPLSTVLSSLSLIEKYDATGIQDKKEKHYKRIKSSVRHLTNLLNDFLSLEKVETGKVYLSNDLVKVKELFQELVEQHQQLTKTGQEIRFEYKGLEEISIDQNMLQIICSNLLSNAIKYSPENRPIDIKASIDQKAFYLEVKDRGIGIPFEDQANMFGRFFRAKNAINFEGTGLGLNIVSKYLQLLNGTITFDSAPNEGTTFYITIPNPDL
jgi:PAS domain S-box-containing protein